MRSFSGLMVLMFPNLKTGIWVGALSCLSCLGSLFVFFMSTKLECLLTLEQNGFSVTFQQKC